MMMSAPVPVTVETAPAQPLAQFEEQVNEPVSTFIFPTPAVDDAELDCLAKNIYHEARGESDAGKLAVAHVTLNRVNSDRFPDTVCGVVHQAVYSKWWLEVKGRKVPVRNKCQFSWYCDGKSDAIVLTNEKGQPIVRNIEAWQASQHIAMQVLLGLTEDPTGGAKWYYNPDLADPYWKHSYIKTVQVGAHKFMRAP